jgi:hypothetical protein
MTLVSWFDEVECENLCDVVGGKGASLCALFQNQFPVVEGFMVCADAFREFMSFNSLWEDVFRALDSIDWVDNSSLAETGEYLRKIIMEAAMPDELVKLIARYYSELGADVPVAVRSSGTAEDLDDASFAGQQETFLFVIGEEDLIRYVKACWASLYNDSAIFDYPRNNTRSDEFLLSRFEQKLTHLKELSQRDIISINDQIAVVAPPIDELRYIANNPHHAQEMIGMSVTQKSVMKLLPRNLRLIEAGHDLVSPSAVNQEILRTVIEGKRSIAILQADSLTCT